MNIISLLCQLILSLSLVLFLFVTPLSWNLTWSLRSATFIKFSDFECLKYMYMCVRQVQSKCYPSTVNNTFDVMTLKQENLIFSVFWRTSFKVCPSLWIFICFSGRTDIDVEAPSVVYSRYQLLKTKLELTPQLEMSSTKFFWHEIVPYMAGGESDILA